MGRDVVEEVRGVGWHLLGGLSKQLKEVRQMLDAVEVPETPTTFVRATRTGAVYSAKPRASLWKSGREVVIYTNAKQATDDRTEWNRVLSDIGTPLTVLRESGRDWSEGKLPVVIEEMLGGKTTFRFGCDGAEPRRGCCGAIGTER